MEEIDNKTHLSQKNSNIITLARGSNKKKSPSKTHLPLLIYSHEQKFKIITGTNHTVQNGKGKFMIKD